MKQFFILILFIFLASACKSPVARPPKSIKSGSFLKESAERNKLLNEAERKSIEQIISSQNVTYKTSEFGFWYRYINKIDSDKKVINDIKKITCVL